MSKHDWALGLTGLFGLVALVAYLNGAVVPGWSLLLVMAGFGVVAWVLDS
jgi:hypothetical protein